MTTIVEWLMANPIMAAAIGAFICGVVLFYLVMRRTQKHRAAQE